MEDEEISDKWAVLQNVSRRQQYKAYHNLYSTLTGSCWCSKKSK